MDTAQQSAQAARPRASHRCPAPGCLSTPPNKYLFCRLHWFRLPISIRRRIWDTYTAGQEDNPALTTPAYREAVRAGLDALRVNQ